MMIRRLILFALLASSAWGQATTPPTVAVTLLFEGPAEQTISGTPQLRIKPHVPFRITNDDGYYWAIPAYWQTIDVTSTTGGQVIALHPNLPGASSYTISPETYYDYEYIDATGSYRGKVQATYGAAVEWGEIHIDDSVDSTSGYLLATDLLEGEGVEVGQEGNSVRITNTSSGFAASNVLAGTGISVGTEGTSVRVTNTGVTSVEGRSGITASGLDSTAATGTVVVTPTYGSSSSTIAEGNDSRFPTAGQKLALAGTSGTPGTGNEYVTDDDPRNTDARTPAAHATSHKHGGSDAVATATPGANEIIKADGDGKVGAGWIDDADIDHNSTGGLDTGDYRHLTAAHHSGLTGGSSTALHSHNYPVDGAALPLVLDASENVSLTMETDTGLVVAASGRQAIDSTRLTITYAQIVSFTGSNLTDLATRNHNDLQNLNAGDYQHWSAANYTDATDGNDSILHYHAADRARAVHTGTQARSTISDFAHGSTHSDGTDPILVDQGVQIADGRVRAKVGAGLAIGADHAIYADTSGITVSGDATGTTLNVSNTKIQGFSLTYPTSHQAMGDNYVWAWDYATQAFTLEAQAGGGGGTLTGQIAGASDTTIDTINASITGQLKATISGDTLTISGTSGVAVQTVYTHYSGVATGTTTVPEDDTEPTSSEGDEYMSVTIVPRGIGNRIHIQARFYWFTSASNTRMISSLFKDAETTARATAVELGSSSQHTSYVDYWFTVQQAGSTTFKFRAGTTAAGTTTMNGFSAARKYGTSIKSTISAVEYIVP